MTKATLPCLRMFAVGVFACGCSSHRAAGSAMSSEPVWVSASVAPSEDVPTDTKAGSLRAMETDIQATLTASPRPVRPCRVVLDVFVGEGGLPRQILVTESCGVAAVDLAAKRAILRAAPFYAAVALRSTPIRVTLEWR